MTILVLVWLVVLVLAKTTYLVKENQRLVILRFGKFEKVIGPGISLVMPFTNLAVLVELNKHLPEWQSITEKERCTILARMVINNPDSKAFK